MRPLGSLNGPCAICALRRSADITIKKRNRGSGGNSDDEADDSADKSAEAAKPAAAAAARPAVAAANPASPAGKPASPGPKPAGGLNAKTSNATVVPPQKPQQQQPQAGSPSLNSTQPAAVQQVQKLQAAPTAANGTAGTDADDACKELGSGLHTLPLACPKFQLCAGGKAWVLYCPKVSAGGYRLKCCGRGIRRAVGCAGHCLGWQGGHYGCCLHSVRQGQCHVPVSCKCRSHLSGAGQGVGQRQPVVHCGSLPRCLQCSAVRERTAAAAAAALQHSRLLQYVYPTTMRFYVFCTSASCRLFLLPS